jgi:hypothetical protein
MALDTYDNLKLEIIDWSHRSDIDLKVDTFIDLAEVEMFSNAIKTLEVRSAETRATASTGTTTRYLALPDGFLEMRRLRLDLDTGFCDLRYRTPEQLVSIDGPSIPKFFTVTSQIEFDTVPDEDYTVEMQYLAEFTPLSSSNQTNAVLTLDPNIYLFGALKELFSWAGDTENEVKYEAKFINAIRGANKKFKAGKYGNSPVMKIA